MTSFLGNSRNQQQLSEYLTPSQKKDTAKPNEYNPYLNFSHFQKNNWGLDGSISRIEQWSNDTDGQFLVTQHNCVRVVSQDLEREKLFRVPPKFNDRMYGASWRNDGKIFVAGTQNGYYQMYHAELMNLKRVIMPLRMKRLSGSPIHVARYLQTDQIFCGADNGDVIVVNVLTNERVWVVPQSHTDFIRAGCQLSSNSFVTGSYDHSCKIWDVRDAACSLEVKQNYPVEDVSKVSEFEFVCVGSTYATKWDTRQSKEPVFHQRVHQNTVLSVQVNAPKSRLYTSGLDRHFNIFDLNEMKLLHSITLDSQLLGAAMDSTEKFLLLGSMGGFGLFSVKTDADVNRIKESTQKLNIDNYKCLVNTYLTEQFVQLRQDVALPSQRTFNLQAKGFHVLLKQFKYSQALNKAVLRHAQEPMVVMSLIEELKSRNELFSALNGRNDQELLPILKFICRWIKDARFTENLIYLTNTVLSIYSPVVGQSSEVDRYLRLIRKRVNEQISLLRRMLNLNGILDSLIICHEVNSMNSMKNEEAPNVNPK